jgi:hypothetical protein
LYIVRHGLFLSELLYGRIEPKFLKAHPPLLTYGTSEQSANADLPDVGTEFGQKTKKISVKNDKTMARLNGFLLVLGRVAEGVP